MSYSTFKSLGIAAAIVAGIGQTAIPCTRVVFHGDAPTNYLMVGRTLDWRNPIPTNIYVYPQGISKQSMPDGPKLEWVSKYASVLVVGYDGGVTEGMNERGLVMNGLFCKGTVYTQSTGPDDKTPVMSLAVLVSFFLDNFRTVAEVDSWLENNKFAIYGKTFDGGTASTLHWAVTDPTGDTLIMEYVAGKLNTYRSSDYTVLTNDPPYDQMLSINEYWKKVGGVNMLPGTVRSSDRFARASFFINHVPKDTDYRDSWAALSSIMGTVSVPYGYTIEGEPNVSSTQWRSISDASGKRYYFKFAYSTGDFWVDMNFLMLKPGSPIMKFDTQKYAEATGCINDKLEKSKGFTPMW